MVVLSSKLDILGRKMGTWSIKLGSFRSKMIISSLKNGHLKPKNSHFGSKSGTWSPKMVILARKLVKNDSFCPKNLSWLVTWPKMVWNCWKHYQSIWQVESFQMTIIIVAVEKIEIWKFSIQKRSKMTIILRVLELEGSFWPFFFHWKSQNSSINFRRVDCRMEFDVIIVFWRFVDFCCMQHVGGGLGLSIRKRPLFGSLDRLGLVGLPLLSDIRRQWILWIRSREKSLDG